MIADRLIDGLTLLALPVLYLTSLFRRRTTSRDRILIIQLGGIGDMVCTTPLLRALATHNNRASITVLCVAHVADVLKENPFVDEVIAVDAPEYKSVFGRVRLLLALKRAGFTVSIGALPESLTAVLGMWTCAAVRIHTHGGRGGPLSYFLHFLHTHPLAYKRHTRTYVHYMRIAELLGAQPSSYRHDIYLSDAERAAADVWLRQRGIGQGAPFAILALTAGNPLKEWPLERFIAVASFLLDEWKIPLLFSAADGAVTHRATMLLPSIRSIDAGGMSIRMLASLIERANLFVSVDTGPLYIAHALGTPVVAILGPVDPEEQAPPPSRRVALVHPLGVEPSLFKGEKVRPTEQQRKAIDACTVDMVIQAVDQMLRQ